MCIEDIISQLESIRANSADFRDSEGIDSIWQKDIEALDAVLAILRGMERQNWWRKLLFRARYMFACRFR